LWSFLLLFAHPASRQQPQQQQHSQTRGRSFLHTAVATEPPANHNFLGRFADGTFVRPRPGPHMREAGPILVQPPLPPGPLIEQYDDAEYQQQQQQAYLYQQAQPQMQAVQGQMHMMQVQQPPLQQQQQPYRMPMQMQMQPQLMQAPPQQMQQHMMQQGQPLMVMPQQQMQQLRQQQMPLQLPLQPELLPQPIQQQAQPQIQPAPMVRYYYYDPAQTRTDEAGNLILPDMVYDIQGHPIPLARLQQETEQVERNMAVAPLRGVFHHDNFTNNADIPRLNITYYHPPTIETPVRERDHKRDAAFVPLAGNPRIMVFPSAPILNSTMTSTSTDQSIIVGTVGVMALLVGALSARRLRSRGVLSMCMDDEHLQDDAAYDTAYTTTTSGTYNTFAWKGDLEKFDV